MADSSVALAIRQALSSGVVSTPGSVRGSVSPALSKFYKLRKFSPAWTHDASLLPAAEQLTAAIADADRDGLRAADYGLASLQAAVRALRNAKPSEAPALTRLAARADVLLSDAFLLYASHLAEGKVDPGGYAPRWLRRASRTNLVARLATAIETGNVRDTLAALPPADRRYRDLRAARESWKSVLEGRDLAALSEGREAAEGENGRRIAALRAALSGAGYPSADGADNTFDRPLVQAISRFQSDVRLPITGRATQATMGALRRELEHRVDVVALNLERWRWMPHDLGYRHVVVNVAAFELSEIEAGREVARMRVVAGTDTWQTPDFTSAITGFSINPSWNAPRHVLVAELLAYIREDPNYLANNRMVLLRRVGRQELQVDPSTIDMETVNSETLDFRLKQDGGPLNVLGRFKFNVPNAHDVYLHDTLNRDDFGKMPRMFSHGCIRVEKPLDLALFLLHGDRRWTRQRLLAAVDAATEKIVTLPAAVPTHVIYATAWADEHGHVRFLDDPYHRDPKLRAALAAPAQRRRTAATD